MKTSVIRHCRAAATSFVLAAAALAAAAGCATRPATGSATVAVTRVVPSETEIPGRRLPFDPIFLRSQFDVIRSAPVLTPVVLSNDLGAVLDAAYGWHMACPDAAADRAVACLRAWTDLSIWRNTDLIGIEVSVDRTVPGAEALSRKLAFDIARSYRANAIALREAEAKATAAQLQSEIDFIQKRIAESGPGDRWALENRRDQLAKRLESFGTLVPYVDVRIMDDPERPATQSPSEKKSHAESAESAEPEPRAIPAAAQETFKIPFSYTWDSPQSSEAMTNALSGVFRAIAGLPDGLRGFSVTTGNGTKAECSVTFDRGRIDYDAAARALQEALGSVPLPEGARLAIVLSEPRANPVVTAPAQADSATNALPAGIPGLYHSRGRPYSSGLVEIDESGRMSAEARDAKWHPVPATQRKLSPVGTIRPAPEAGPGLLAFTSDETGPDGKRGVGHLAFDADRLTIHWLAYDKERARPWTVEFAETGFFYDPREDLIRLDTDLATLWCDTIYRTEPSDGGVSEIVYSLWDHVGNLSPQQRRDLDEILARKIHSLSICRAMMHLDDDLGAPLRNPYDGKPDPILDVSPDLRPAITKIIAPATNAAPAHPATPSPAASESHAESAEAAESGSPAGGAGERSETEGVSHAENAESAEP